MTSPTGVPFLDGLVASLATEAEEFARGLSIGDWGTAGPEAHPPIPDVTVNHAAFVDGWWRWAKRFDSHPGRRGGPIRAYSTGIHTTDMLPDEWDALIAAWTTKPGDGACANFLIGRDEAHGVVQFIPITNNSNHMGGAGHGVFMLVDGKQVHPNLVTNSIEIHCAGGVRQLAGQWRLVENGVAHGTAIADIDVIPDPNRPGRGWHKITDYQFEQLAILLHDLDGAQPSMPDGITTLAFGEEVPTLAKMPTARVVTHWQMDPVHRSDPWNQACKWLHSHLA